MRDGRTNSKLQLAKRRAETIARRQARWMHKFIAALSRTPSVKHACIAAGIHRNTAYEHRSKNSEFARRWEQAIEASVDQVESRAFKLALKGDDHVAANLITFLLRCHRPAIYRERNEVAVAGGIVFLPAKKEGAE